MPISATRLPQVGLHAQAVEHMFEQHARAVADGRQIELRIAEFERVHQLEQPLGAGGVEGDPDVARACDQQFMFGLSRHGRAAYGSGTLSRAMESSV